MKTGDKTAQVLRFYLFVLLHTIYTVGAYGQDLSLLPPSHYLHQEVSKLVFYDTPIKSESTPGYLIGMITEDSIYVLSIGQRGKHDTSQLDIHDRFQIGSVSKVVTAALVANLVDQGKLDWDQTLSGILPDECTQEAIRNITVSELLSHQSNLPKYPNNFGSNQSDPNQPYHDYTAQHLCNYLQSATIISQKEPVYSHLNFAVLELMIVALFDNKSFEEIAEDHLFSPLKMKDSAFSPQPRNLTDGLNRGGRDAESWTFQSFLAAEGGISSIADMVTLARWYLGMGEPGVSVQTRQSLLAPMGSSSLGPDIKSCRGFQLIYPKKKWPVYLHSGHTNQHYAFIGLCPKTTTGVVILSNSSVGTYNLGYLILRMLNHQWKNK